METNLSESQQKYVEIWNKLQSLPDRDEKNIYLVKIIDNIQLTDAKQPGKLSKFESDLYELYKDEWSHQEIVIRSLRSFGNQRRHDWSKDYLYIFALAGKFKFQIPTEQFQDDAQKEIERHYRLEPHHPEFEKTSGEINILDLQEMAIDRLSRNVWKNKGSIDDQEMNRYLPSFFGSDPEAKLEKYKLSVKLMGNKVQQVYNQLLQESEELNTLQKMNEMVLS